MSDARLVIAAIFAALSSAAIAYFAISIWAADRFRDEKTRFADGGFAPAVSILKSLKGLDPHMLAAFRSHCVLDYPEYEVLFGVQDLDEPAIALVKQLQVEFPERKLRVVHCPQLLGPNGKVSTLAQMLPQAQYEYVIINDSDILVERDYLSRVMAPFANSEAGMVTTLYRALAGESVGSKLEALGISTDFAGGVLVARALEGGIRFGLGATLATTKTVLRQIGGLEPLVDYLGDDYELGARIAAAGRQVVLADVVVETALPDYSFREFWLHQIRWARNVKDRRPAQYVGLMLTFGVPWAVAAVFASPLSWWTWLVLLATFAMRMSAAMKVGRGVLHDPQLTRDLWLVPLRDFVALAVWIWSYAGNTVHWRGLRFRLHNGKLEKI
jgi:ceramide glucosyltransferase